MTASEFLERMDEQQTVMPVSDIRIATLFLGNPVAPCGPWPGRSASMGEGLWIRTPHGVASVFPNWSYDGQSEMSNWVIEGYLPVGADVLQVLVTLKQDFVNLLFFAKTHCTKSPKHRHGCKSCGCATHTPEAE